MRGEAPRPRRLLLRRPRPLAARAAAAAVGVVVVVGWATAAAADVDGEQDGLGSIQDIVKDLQGNLELQRLVKQTIAQYQGARQVPAPAQAPKEAPVGPPACPPADNSTRELLRCILWRKEAGEAQFNAETMSPTQDADDTAQEHLLEISREALKPTRVGERPILLENFQSMVRTYQATGSGMPKVYALQGGNWGQACKYVEHTLGYRYSLEHWMHTFLLENTVSVKDVEQADFVYLPHCATGIFMHMVAKDVKDAETSETAVLRRTRRPANRTATRYLAYEGNLPEDAVRRTDDSYLMRLLSKNWMAQPAFGFCLERPTCRFLIVSVYGRHVWRRWSATFGGRAVIITHAGLSGWIPQLDPSLFLWPPPATEGAAPARLPPHGGSGGGGSGGGGGGSGHGHGECRATCELHCQLEPPAVLPDDLVVPWTVAFSWTARAARFRHRDILAFYSGTENSCSRKLLHDMYTGSFDEELRYWTAAPAGSGGGAEPPRRRGRPPQARRSIVFPPSFRLLQEEWSELAFRSQVCIVPDGDSPNTGRLIEVIMHGCVPLIVSERLQPPFHEYVDWHSIAFFMREAALPELPRVLAWLATPAGTRAIRARHQFLEQASHLFDYDRDIVGSLVMFSLRDRARRAREAAGAVT